jgi:hypothetical protein
MLVEHGTLQGTIRIPNAAGDIEVFADLSKRQLRTSVGLSAPATGRPRTRINWLTRQLGAAPVPLRVDVRFAGRRQTTSNLLSALTIDPSLGLLDAQTDPRAFEIAAISDLAIGRRTGRNSFIESVRASVQDFYESVVQDLRPWTPGAPRLAVPEETGPAVSSSPSPLEKWLRAVAEGKTETS